jgi:hypothetical protein
MQIYSPYQLDSLLDLPRFWYENEDTFSREQINEIKRISLARVICDTGDSITHVKQDVFSMRSNLVNCNLIPSIRLELWTADDCCGFGREESCRRAYNQNRESNEIRKRRSVESSESEGMRLIELSKMKPIHSFYDQKFETIENAVSYLRNVTDSLNYKVAALGNRNVHFDNKE